MIAGHDMMSQDPLFT